MRTKVKKSAGSCSCLHKETKNAIYLYVAAAPVAYFAFSKLAANPTSNKPPIINMPQFVN